MKSPQHVFSDEQQIFLKQVSSMHKTCNSAMLRGALVITIALMHFAHLHIFARPLDETCVDVEAHWLEGPVIVTKSPEGVTREESSGRTMLVYIINKKEEPIRIPTKCLSLEHEGENSQCHIIMKWAHPVLASKYNIIIPESKMDIVELRKDESAFLSFTIDNDWPLYMKPMYLRMAMPSKIWKRYNLDYFQFDASFK